MFPFVRRDTPKVFEYQRWKHFDLSDFHTASFRAQLSYGWLWFLAIIAVAVYAADTYTAVNLLAYNTWPGQIKPTIPFNASKWVFAGCILFSWVLCAYEWFRAFRIMRQGSVAKDYLDPLAATIQSIRVYPGGRGYQRFLVFAQLTKSKKGVDYLALFSYFQFKGSVRIILAEGPRQAINALTLYSVMHTNLLSNDKSQTKPSLAQFASNVRVLAERQTVHATILFTMLFTLVIWIFSALSFIFACIIYCTFLCHYLPDRRLSRYCRRKIDRRLRRIVDDTIAKVLERGDGKKVRKEKKLPQATVTEIPAPPMRAPSFPRVANDDDDDNMSMTTTLSRNPTQSTLPNYNLSRPVSRAPLRKPIPIPVRPAVPWDNREDIRRSQVPLPLQAGRPAANTPAPRSQPPSFSRPLPVRTRPHSQYVRLSSYDSH